MLWRELPFLDRFAAAKDAGFDTVEFWWPRGTSPEDVEAAVHRHDLNVSILNMDAGDLDAGERGYLNRPECHPAVLTAAREAIALANAVKCPFVNSPVGKDAGTGKDTQAAAIVGVLREMADTAVKGHVLITLEPLNSVDHPSYLMCSTGLALDWIGQVGPGVGLLYDAYHMGCMGDDIVAAAQTLKPAHVQIADCPGRHEPGSGRLPFGAFFEALEKSDYAGYVGLEYAPNTSTAESLAWLHR